MSETQTIPGYAYGQVPASPLATAELELLLNTLTFNDQDRANLAQAKTILEDQVEAILDVWYGFVGSQPQLLAHFSDPEGRPIPEYLGRVRARFGQWILDTLSRPYDGEFLAYAYEIGRRHQEKKNQTDQVQSTSLIPLRYLLALTYPIVATVKPFLAQKGATPAEVESMHQAWFKAVLLQVILWSQPYTKADQF